MNLLLKCSIILCFISFADACSYSATTNYEQRYDEIGAAYKAGLITTDQYTDGYKAITAQRSSEKPELITQPGQQLSQGSETDKNTPSDAINKQMSMWVGHSKDQLITTWGAPQQIMPDGRGGEIYVYSEYVPMILPFPLLPGEPSGWQRQRIFWINTGGIIYRWSWKGL